MDVTFKNKNIEYGTYVDQVDFVLRNGDNITEVYECSDTINLEDPFGRSSDLLPNESHQGEIAFEVPDNVTNLILAYYGFNSYGEIELIQSSKPETEPQVTISRCTSIENPTIYFCSMPLDFFEVAVNPIRKIHDLPACVSYVSLCVFLIFL